MTIASALLVSRDQALVDDVLRLCAAAGLLLDVTQDPAAAMPGWSSTAVVLVGADQALAMAAQCPERREQVYVVGHGPVEDGLFRSALAAGAQAVVELPAAETWLVELLTDVSDGQGEQAITLGVIGGSGGVGATTLAAAIALTAAARGEALLIDLDPVGAAVGQVVGLDCTSGAGWEAISESPGRFGSRSLRAALPGKDSLAVLSWRGVPVDGLGPSSVREVLAAARRGNRTVVLDLPRSLGPAAVEALSRCDQVLMVCARTVTGVTAARGVTARVRETVRVLRLAVRGSPSVMAATDLERTLGADVVVEVPDQKRLDEHIALGLGPVYLRRGPLVRAARRVLDELETGSSR